MSLHKLAGISPSHPGSLSCLLYFLCMLAIPIFPLFKFEEFLIYLYNVHVHIQIHVHVYGHCIYIDTKYIIVQVSCNLNCCVLCVRYTMRYGVLTYKKHVFIARPYTTFSLPPFSYPRHGSHNLRRDHSPRFPSEYQQAVWPRVCGRRSVGGLLSVCAVAR